MYNVLASCSTGDWTSGVSYAPHGLYQEHLISTLWYDILIHSWVVKWSPPETNILMDNRILNFCSLFGVWRTIEIHPPREVSVPSSLRNCLTTLHTGLQSCNPLLISQGCHFAFFNWSGPLSLFLINIYSALSSSNFSKLYSAHVWSFGNWPLVSGLFHLS